MGVCHINMDCSTLFSLIRVNMDLIMIKIATAIVRSGQNDILFSLFRQVTLSMYKCTYTLYVSSKLHRIYYRYYTSLMLFVLLNTHSLLALLDCMTCNYFWQTCHGVIIDHVIDMTYQYWLHPKTKWTFSLLGFQKTCCFVCLFSFIKSWLFNQNFNSSKAKTYNKKQNKHTYTQNKQ